MTVYRVFTRVGADWRPDPRDPSGRPLCLPGIELEESVVGGCRVRVRSVHADGDSLLAVAMMLGQTQLGQVARYAPR